MDNMQRLSLNQMTVNQWTLDEAIEGCARIGIPAIGIWREKLVSKGVEHAALRIRDAGLRVSSLCRGGWFDDLTPAGRREGMEDNFRAVEEAATLGAPVLVLVCGPAASRDLDAGRAYIAEAIAELVPYAAQHGVLLGIEPMHPMYTAERSAIVTVAQALAIARQYPEDQVGVIIDAYHVWWDPEIMPQIHIAGPRICGLHLADWLVPTSDMLNGRGMIGDGVIDLRALRQAVDSTGYSADIEVEIFNAELWQLAGEEVLSLVKERYLACV
jgi:sugar phosphate isomerase/epimerase